MVLELHRDQPQRDAPWQLLVGNQSANSDGGRPTAGLLFLSLSKGRPSSDCRRRSGLPSKDPPWQPDSRDPDAR